MIGRNVFCTPPKRGNGRNAPYIYERFISHWSEDADEPITLKYEFNLDDGFAHLNSLFFQESNIPNRLIAHYLYGQGFQYDLTLTEFNELGITIPNITNNKQFLIANIGTTEGTFIVPSVFARQDGTVGEASFVYNGTLQKNNDGTFIFNGTMNLVDRYDFNWRDPKRSLDNKILTWWGSASMNGKDFKIQGPTIKIKETNRYHSYFGGTGIGRSAVNGGKDR